MAFVIRRSIPSLLMLLGLVFAGGAVLVWLGAPLWVPVALSLTIVLVQWLIGPRLVEWLIPADEIRRRADGAGYETDDPFPRLVAHRCLEAGIPLVRLGIIDDGNPNAFTFGHTRRDARIRVTKGLLERLDEREIDAVVSHE